MTLRAHGEHYCDDGCTATGRLYVDLSVLLVDVMEICGSNFAASVTSAEVPAAISHGHVAVSLPLLQQSSGPHRLGEVILHVYILVPVSNTYVLDLCPVSYAWLYIRTLVC